jgi:hypothetical protein
MVMEPFGHSVMDPLVNDATAAMSAARRHSTG